jgi:hypothetical protein
LVAISLPPSDQWLNGAMGAQSVAFQMRQHPKSGNNSGEAMRPEDVTATVEVRLSQEGEFQSVAGVRFPYKDVAVTVREHDLYG